MPPSGPVPTRRAIRCLAAGITKTTAQGQSAVDSSHKRSKHLHRWIFLKCSLNSDFNLTVVAPAHESGGCSLHGSKDGRHVLLSSRPRFFPTPTIHPQPGGVLAALPGPAPQPVSVALAPAAGSARKPHAADNVYVVGVGERQLERCLE